jgi:hypothetical protein
MLFKPRSIYFGGKFLYGNYKSSGDISMNINLNTNKFIENNFGDMLKFFESTFGLSVAGLVEDINFGGSFNSKYDESRVGVLANTGICFNKWIQWYGSGMFIPSQQEINYILNTTNSALTGKNIVVPTQINGVFVYISPLTFGSMPYTGIYVNTSFGCALEIGKVKTTIMNLDEMQFIHAGPAGYIDVGMRCKVVNWLEFTSGLMYFRAYCPNLNNIRISDDNYYELKLGLGKRNIEYKAISLGVNFYF